MMDFKEMVRFELRVLRQLRIRMRTLSDIRYVDLAGILGLMIQAYEGLLSPEDSVRYRQLLRRRLCVPEGTPANVAIAFSDLPELPELDPPLGVCQERTEVVEPFERKLRTLPGGKADGAAPEGDPDGGRGPTDVA